MNIKYLVIQYDDSLGDRCVIVEQEFDDVQSAISFKEKESQLSCSLNYPWVIEVEYTKDT